MQTIPTEVKQHLENIYEIPTEQNISLSVLEKQGFMKAQTAKKMIHRGDLRAINMGKKFFIPRMELIRYLANSLGLIKEEEV